MKPVPIDIFCQVIDNFGDAGVCWRLARQLSALRHPVRLWISDGNTLSQLVPGVDHERQSQHVEGVHVLVWNQAEYATPPPGGIVIEAFGCTLPQGYRQALMGQECLWINLEYLSAEDWVEQWHGLPSPQADGLCRYFYFPGFTEATGGLLREPGVAQAQTTLENRHMQLHRLTGLDTRAWPADSLSVLLFCYPHAPVVGLQRVLAAMPRPVQLLVPDSISEVPESSGSLHVHRIPFVAQRDFDALLRCCDLNLVRGEDSLVRALWARQPTIWQLYPQEEDVRMAKLAAWLQTQALPPAVLALQNAWNLGDADAFSAALSAALQEPLWSVWRQRTHEYVDALCRQEDLVTRLLRFCVTHRQTG